MSTQRIYSAPDVVMLVSAATVIESAIAAKEFLVSKRPAWKDPYFTDIQTRINQAFPELLGIQSTAQLKETTGILTAQKATLVNDIGELKVQIKVDYQADQAETLLNRLGIGKSNSGYKSKDEALVESLQLFKTNMTLELKLELTAKGIAPQLIENILQQGEAFTNVAVRQEALKGSSRTITEAGITELNALYNEAIGIAKIARAFYKGQLIEQDKFSFSKLLRAQSGGKSAPQPVQENS